MKGLLSQVAMLAPVTAIVSGAIVLNLVGPNQVGFAAALTPRTPIILDDDGSQDGMTAWAYILANPKYEVKAMTISQGIARPEIFANNVEKMLGRLNVTGIPVGIGRSTPLAGSNEFPSFIRDGSDTFWSPFVTLPATAPAVERRNAVELIIETIKSSPVPVDILATGPLTNIAEALRLDPTIIGNISTLQIMGGAVFVPGNLTVLPDPPFSTNTAGEFNIWIDPVAAQEVFDAGNNGLRIQLTPLDATNKISFSRADQAAWLATGTPESVLASELLDFAISVIQSDNDPNPAWSHSGSDAECLGVLRSEFQQSAVHAGRNVLLSSG
jgi:purine nucleosidase/pyrimidine-specific ribonucleoside hydrolase